MASIHKDIQALLEHDPDAVECGACKLFYKPEKFDGEFLVHVLRITGDPPGTPGVAVCTDCLEIFQKTGQLTRDVVKVH